MVTTSLYAPSEALCPVGILPHTLKVCAAIVSPTTGIDAPAPVPNGTVKAPHAAPAVAVNGLNNPYESRSVPNAIRRVVPDEFNPLFISMVAVLVPAQIKETLADPVVSAADVAL